MSVPYGFNWGGGSISYVYSGTQNNGQITQVVDSLSGETITYQYDALKRLTSACSSLNNCTSAPTTFQYDGFGNLTSKTLAGVTSAIPVTAATNQLSNASYDANGNMYSGAGVTMTYDEANRVTSASPTSGGTEYYGYAPDNKRVWHLKSDGVTEEWTLYGARGEKIGVYQWSGLIEHYDNQGNWLDDTAGFSVLRTNVWFDGKLISESGAPVIQDRLGTNRAYGARFMPYGEETSSTANDRVKFATYTRDSFTGLDYADQRFYASSYGRFSTPDPYQAAAKGANDLNTPISWNRYGYVLGDPINGYDPQGLFTQAWQPVAWCGDGQTLYNGACVTMFYGPTVAPIPALPKCTATQVVRQTILADAANIGLTSLSTFTSATVQLVGTTCSLGTPECGQNGLFTQTELNLSGVNVQQLQGQLLSLGFACAPSSNLLTNIFVGDPHKPFSDNCRQSGLTNSLQVNSDLATGTVQLDIDPFVTRCVDTVGRHSSRRPSGCSEYVDPE